MHPDDFEHRALRSFDGTTIAYQVAGRGPPIVLANGLGGSYEAWARQVHALGPGYRYVAWDYRGMFGSERPRDLSTLSFDHQARDLELVLHAEGIERAIFVGLSLGVQLTFEYYRRRPEHFAGIVAVSGLPGRIFTSAVGGPVLDPLLRYLARGIQRSAPLLHDLNRRALRWKGLIPLAKRVRVVAPTLDEQVFAGILERFTSLDLEIWAEMVRHVGAHDASEVLPRIAVPTLVISGSKDTLTPPAPVSAMARRISRAELVIIEGGTHFTLYEFSEQVNGHLKRFVGQVHGA